MHRTRTPVRNQAFLRRFRNKRLVPFAEQIAHEIRHYVRLDSTSPSSAQDPFSLNRFCALAPTRAET